MNEGWRFTWRPTKPIIDEYLRLHVSNKAYFRREMWNMCYVLRELWFWLYFFRELWAEPPPPPFLGLFYGCVN